MSLAFQTLLLLAIYNPLGFFWLYSPFLTHTHISLLFMSNAPTFDILLPPQKGSLLTNAQLSHTHHRSRRQDPSGLVGCLGCYPSNQDLLAVPSYYKTVKFGVRGGSCSQHTKDQLRADFYLSQGHLDQGGNVANLDLNP